MPFPRTTGVGDLVHHLPANFVSYRSSCCISSSHSLESMGRCQYQHCKTHAVYNVEGSSSAVFCKQHSKIGMVNVIHKLCLNDACTKQPSFGVAGSKTSMYCKQHAKAGMVNVLSKRCLDDSCTRRPSFNVEGHKPAAYLSLIHI